ncbi:PTS system, cellobiose-specific IIB component [Seinonella peptonophila]|uniref:PTS system, cellobiose-specific IIB component n=1 Tax=Seinonella peptonophila TaxID=112248 RepID=A0A1M4VL02_9BACL|nr:PTS sugar transporter subunit IIB [Seinonella peptonophila]SHE69503.1 PTS system, cellobiose-specific IIB component [Seinonella peptonophila]
MNILLVCSAGMSTSILVNKMQQAASKQNIEVQIEALSEADLKSKLDQADVILIGPQVRYLKTQIQKKAKPHQIPVDVIDSIAYGTMDGDKVLAQAKGLIEKKKPGVL